jgi:hypothetical protein
MGSPRQYPNDATPVQAIVDNWHLHLRTGEPALVNARLSNRKLESTWTITALIRSWQSTGRAEEGNAFGLTDGFVRLDPE